MSNVDEGGHPENPPNSQRTGIFSGNWTRANFIWIGVVSAAVVLLAAGVLFSPPNFIAKAPDDISALTPQTEAAFIAQQSSLSSDVMAEWRDVRGDHKIIAYAIAYCKAFRATIGNIDTMPRNVFSALLLDLTPLGEHKFLTRAAEVANTTQVKPVSQNPAPTGATETAATVTGSAGPSVAIATKVPFDLSSYQQSMLALSDAIGRARLTAASEASGNYPKMTTFGWVTIGISAIATLLVTIKASMSPPAPEARKMTFVFIGVGLLAMSLSALGTALTSAKQFYDPTRAYRMSKAALSELQRLHKEAALEFARTLDSESCGATGQVSQARLKEWSTKLTDLQAAVLMASSNLQGSDIVQLKAEVGVRPAVEQPAQPAAAGINATRQ